MNSVSKRAYGNAGEDKACEFLEERGYTTIARNYHGGRYGEIDIVASIGNAIIFVEVKTRHNDSFGGGIYSITANKKKHLKKAAEHFLVNNPSYNTKDFTFQFDLIIIENGKLQHVEDILR